jgi:hypothetical protein
MCANTLHKGDNDDDDDNDNNNDSLIYASTDITTYIGLSNKVQTTMKRAGRYEI